MSFRAAEDLNPDTAGNALPTVVRVLQLVSTSRLENASFNAIWQDPKKVLGSDLLRSDELTVDPGQTSGAWVKRSPRAQYVVAVGIFRQPTGDSWRATAVMPEVTPEQCGAQPTKARTGPPGRGDLNVRFLLQGNRIDVIVPQAAPAQGAS